MSSVKVKICGITSILDAKMAVNAGANALGLVFYRQSSRYVTPQIAREISLAVGSFTVITGLFVNSSKQEIDQVLSQVPLNLLQFHGDESGEFCESFQRPYMKAIRMRPNIDLDAVFKEFESASAILLDAYKPGIPGGTGESFDWQRVPKNSARPIVLAGGLTPSNVAMAIQSTGVYGVDVSGGVEASAGRKDGTKLQEFVINAQLAHDQLIQKGV